MSSGSGSRWSAIREGERLEKECEEKSASREGVFVEECKKRRSASREGVQVEKKE